jgi:hypothetical protein
MTWRPKHLIEGRLDNRTPGKVTGWMRFYRPHKRWRERVFWITLDLEGDFHEDIRGVVLWLLSDDRFDRKDPLGPECDLEGFDPVQRGQVGDITAGLPLGRWSEDISRAVLKLQELRWDKLGISGHDREARRREVLDQHRRCITGGAPFFPFTPFPYLEWFSEQNGRVVLDLSPLQMDVHWGRNTLKQRPVKTPEELFADEERRAAAFSNFVAGGTVVRVPYGDRGRGDALAATS